MDNKWINDIVHTSRKKLKAAVEDDQLSAVKYVLENLDASFSLPIKEVLNKLYTEISSDITQLKYLDKKQKLNLLEFIKTKFDNVE